VDQRQRLVFLVLVIAWTIFRLLRYLRISGAKHPPQAVPPSDGSPVPPRSEPAAATPATATASPIEPAGSGGAGLARNLVAAAVFIAGSLVIWALVFMVPAFENVPTLVRMIVGVLATLCLIQLARGIGIRVMAAGQRGAADENNPIK
jgi:hypothetical protein